MTMLRMCRETLIAHEISRIPWNHPMVLRAMFFMLFNPLYWNTIGRLEFRKKRLSRLPMFGGDQRLACNFFAATIFALGLYRDYL